MFNKHYKLINVQHLISVLMALLLSTIATSAQATQRLLFENKWVDIKVGELCADAFSNDVDANIYFYRCHNGDNQKWKIDSQGRIRSKMNNDYCFDLNNNSDVRLGLCDENAASQRFRFLFSGTFGFMQSLDDQSNCLRRGNDNNLYLDQCGTTNDFNFGLVTQAHFNLFSEIRVQGRCVNLNPNNNVILATCDGSEMQQWKMDNQGRVHHKTDQGLCFDLSDMSTASNTNLQIASCNDGVATQKFGYRNGKLVSNQSLDSCLTVNNDDDIRLDACKYDPYSTNEIEDIKQKFYFNTVETLNQWSEVKIGNQCVDAVDNYEGANVYLYPCHNGSNQRWKMDSNGIVRSSMNPDLCVTNKGGTDSNVQLEKCQSGATSQRFQMFNGNIALASDRRYCLNGDNPNNNITVKNCKNEPLSQFVWRQTEQVGKWAEIAIDGKCVDAYRDNLGANVYAYNCHGGDNQKWKMDQQGRIHSKINEDFCLVLNNASTDAGTNLKMDECHDHINEQKFDFINGHLVSQVDKNKCLDRGLGNDNLYLYYCHGQNNQKFSFNVADPIDHLAPLRSNQFVNDALDQLAGILSISNVKHQPLLDGEMLRIEGTLNAEQIVTSHSGPQGKLIKAAFDMAKELGLQSPTPVVFTVTGNLNSATIDIAVDFNILDTWQVHKIEIVEYIVNTMNLVFHWKINVLNGAITTAVDIKGLSYIKPNPLDSWLEVTPNLTLGFSAAGITRTLGATIHGQCDQTPTKGMNGCRSDWNVLSLGLVTAHSVVQPNGINEIGSLAITYGVDGLAKSMAVDAQDVTLSTMGSGFNGQFNSDLENPDNWAAKLGINAFGKNFSLEQDLRPGVTLKSFPGVSVSAPPAYGSMDLIFENSSLAVKFTGKLCVNLLFSKLCSPSFSQKVNSDGKVCFNIPGFGQSCARLF